MRNPNYDLPTSTRSMPRAPRQINPAFGVPKTNRQLIKERNLKSLKKSTTPFEDGITGVNPFDAKYDPVPQMPRHGGQRKVAQHQFGRSTQFVAAEGGFKGVVQKPTYFLVGEKGPERVSVIPLKKQKHKQGVKFGGMNRFTDTNLPSNRLMDSKLPSGRLPKY